MRPQKTLAYLVPQSIREHVNMRAAALHVNRKVAIGRSDSLAEGDYQDAISRLYELQQLVNTIARTENAAIIEAHEDFNAGLFIEDRSAIDYEGPQDFDIFWGPLPSGPSSVATAKGDALIEWDANTYHTPTEAAEAYRVKEAKQIQAIEDERQAHTGEDKGSGYTATN